MPPKQDFRVYVDKAVSASISKVVTGGKTRALVIGGVGDIRISRYGIVKVLSMISEDFRC